MNRPWSVLTVGESMGLAVNDRAGTLDASRQHTVSFGGAESNVAIALSRLGGQATWVSRLGEDPFGRLIARELAAEGVRVIAELDPVRPTGFMHKLRRTAEIAEVTFWRAGSAASALDGSTVTKSLVAAADLVHLTGILPGLSETAKTCALHVARLASESGTPLSFDINHRNKVWKQREAVSVYRELISHAKIVFAGTSEAALLVGDGTPSEQAKRLADLGPTEVVIKLGADGALALIDDVEYTQTPISIDVVDSVGAGDAFVAGYLSSLLEGENAPSRLVRAGSSGAFACLSIGDWEGAPTHRDLQTFAVAEGVHR